MITRPTGLALSAAAGGILAILSTGIAAADTYDYVIDPTSETQLVNVTGIPPLYVETTSYSIFDVNDTTLGGTTTNPDIIGQFNGQYYTLTTNSGFTNELIRVDLPYPDGQDVPTTNSIFDTTTFGGGYENIYTDLVGAGTGGTNLITDTLDTPLGNINIPTDFDAAEIIHALLGTTT